MNLAAKDDYEPVCGTTEPPTLYEVVQAAAEQIDNLTQAIARVGERLNQAEMQIAELMRQVNP